MRFKGVLTLLLMGWLVVLLPISVGGVVFGQKISAQVVSQHNLAIKETIMNSQQTGVTILDRHDRLLFAFDTKTRRYSPLNAIPLHMRQAVVAIEDHTFYTHWGFSPRAIVRSGLRNWEKKEFVVGGSTITQQLVKNLLLSPDRSLTRKFKEIILAYELEKKYTKDEILEMYLNSIYFGQGAFGMENAASAYFNKPVQDLTIAESAFLAGLIPAPSYFAGHRPEAFDRQKVVLQKMHEQGFISEDQYAVAAKEWLTFHEQPSSTSVIEAPHFVFMVRQQLIERFGEQVLGLSGYQIKTTLDLDWQKKAEAVLQEQLTLLASSGVSNGAAVGIDPASGEIIFMVGSKNWSEPQFGEVNLALSPRQPGSAFKPIIYAAALEKGLITPASILRDYPKEFTDNYKPRNFDNRFHGLVSVRKALASSFNVPTVDLLATMGVPEVVTAAKRLGISTLQNPAQLNLSLALGAAEIPLRDLTHAYAAFANGGTTHQSQSILEVRDRAGYVIYRPVTVSHQAIRPGVAFLISSILSDTSARRSVFGEALTISRPAAVKTGTTEQFRDAWTVGYTPQLAIGVWIGNNDFTPMNEVAGSLGAAPIWRSLMETFLEGKPVAEFQPPADVERRVMCRYTGQPLAKGRVTERNSEYFLVGTPLANYCPHPSPPPSPTPSN